MSEDGELRREYRLLSAALSAQRDFIYAFDVKGRFLFANQALCDLLLKTPAEMVGKTFDDLHYPEPLATDLQRQIQEVVSTRRIVREQTPFTAPNGSSRIYEYIFCPVFDEAGEVEAVAGTTRDVTEQHGERARLLDINAALQGLFSQAPGFIAILKGRNHVFEMCNAAYMALIGDRDVLGKPVGEALPEAASQGFVNLLDEVRQSGKPYVGNATRFDVARTKWGPLEETYVDFVYQPIVDSNQQVAGIFVQGHDVTQQHLAQQALVHADLQKDRFIATLAHELRNPLAPIRTGAEVLNSPALSPERLKKTAEIIGRQVGHMARLLDDLLDVARISNNQMRLHKEQVTVDALIATAVETSRPLIDAKRHRLTIVHYDGAIALDGDVIRLTQVLSNLLGNAAKYTNGPGEISVASRIEGDECVIAVTDQGIGLSSDGLKNIFSMFAQEQAAINRSEGGLGIGLALAQGLVELHEGSISAFSAGPGQGSTFTVRLPRRMTTRAVHEKHPIRADTAGIQKKVLVADDNLDSVTMLATLLELMGHVVLTATNGIEALETAKMEHPDIAVLDIGMPKMNGLEVARAIRGEPWGQGMVLIAATGWGSAEDQSEALAAGFDAHLTKPFLPEQLENLLQQF